MFNLTYNNKISPPRDAPRRIANLRFAQLRVSLSAHPAVTPPHPYSKKEIKYTNEKPALVLFSPPPSLVRLDPFDILKNTLRHKHRDIIHKTKTDHLTIIFKDRDRALTIVIELRKHRKPLFFGRDRHLHSRHRDPAFDHIAFYRGELCHFLIFDDNIHRDPL